MKKIYLTVGFCLVALIQLYVPSQMIFGQETILNQGKVYKFKTRPIDPNDPFRGKYVTLAYEINSFVTNDSTWQRNEDVYVYLKDGLYYAEVDTVSKHKLELKNDYVMAKVRRLQHSWPKQINKPSVLYFDLPFNRFYMEEHKAKPAELAVRRRWNDTIVKNVYGLVYVKQGKATLKDVYINDVAIKDYVEQDLK